MNGFWRAKKMYCDQRQGRFDDTRKIRDEMCIQISAGVGAVRAGLHQ